MRAPPQCDTCGKPIEGNAWRAYPARVEDGQLFGTALNEETGDHRPIGPAVDLHSGCGPKGHPLDAHGD